MMWYFKTDRLLLISVATLLMLLLAGAIPSVISADQNNPGSKTTQSSYSATPSRILLTPNEKRYLERLGPITVCPDPDWLPYSQMDSKGSFTGIAADLMKLLSERLGINFTYIHAKDWDEAVALSQAGKVLLLPFLNQTPKRDQWLTFTEPLFLDSNVFITREEHPFITDASLLKDKTIAVPSGTSIEEKVRRDYPNLKILNTGNSESEVFKAVAERRADLTLRSLTVSAYTIRKGGWFTLKIAGQAPDEYVNRLRIGVIKSEPKLRDILNKGIATITPQEREEITNRHVNITVVKPMDYGFILRIAAVLALLIGLSLYWNLRLKKTNAALAEQEQLWRTIINTSPDGIMITSLDGVIRHVSEKLLSMTGYGSADELIGRNMLDFIDPAWQDKAIERIDMLLQGTYTGAAEYLVIRKDGSQVYIEANAEILRNSDGTPREIFIVDRDITERKQVEEQLRSLSVAVEQSPVSVVITDLNGVIQYVNPKFEQVTGYTASEAVGQNPSVLKSGKTDQSVFDGLWRTLHERKLWQGEFINRRKNGDLFYEEAYISPVSDANGVVSRYVAVKLDISERKQIEEQIQHMARYDNLTDLPNRALFTDRIERAVLAAQRNRCKLALFFIDLDKFKPINDELGHAVGDWLLQAVAQRMTEAVRESDTVARIGGDEFAVLLPSIATPQDACNVAEKIRCALNRPFIMGDGVTLAISCSIGVALYPEHGDRERDLLRAADEAMYRAKQGGRNAVELCQLPEE
jgi:diguanylate cyclase (GGDEF)-like protein/PAS domain S-box-containing protein